MHCPNKTVSPDQLRAGGMGLRLFQMTQAVRHQQATNESLAAQGERSKQAMVARLLMDLDGCGRFKPGQNHQRHVFICLCKSSQEPTLPSSSLGVAPKENITRSWRVLWLWPRNALVTPAHKNLVPKGNRVESRNPLMKISCWQFLSLVSSKNHQDSFKLVTWLSDQNAVRQAVACSLSSCSLKSCLIRAHPRQEILSKELLGVRLRQATMSQEKERSVTEQSTLDDMQSQTCLQSSAKKHFHWVWEGYWHKHFKCCLRHRSKALVVLATDSERYE